MIIVEYETDSVILQQVRQAVPEMTLTIETQQALTKTVMVDPSPIRLLFWASGGDFEAFEAAIEDDPTVTQLELLTDAGRRRLYRVVLTENGMKQSVYPQQVELDGSLLEGKTTEDGWQFRMLFPDRQSVTAFRNWYEDHDFPFELNGMFTAAPLPDASIGPKLTHAQREALSLAWQRGYFQIPRQTELNEIAEELAISDTAVSQRIRRGINTVLTSQFGMTPD